VPDGGYIIDDFEMPADPGRLRDIRSSLQVIDHNIPRLARLEEIVTSVERLAAEATSIEVVDYLSHVTEAIEAAETFDGRDDASVVADLVKRRELFRRLWTVASELERRRPNEPLTH
jgi:chromosome condensin MukBEF complex kleisin-like MukF subunit